MELICTFRDVKRGTTVTVACPISYEELKSRMGLDEGQDLEYIVVDSTENLVREGQDYLESCTLLPEVDSKRDLGHYYVDEVGISNLSKDTLESYFDYEAYGRDIDITNQGGFSSYGYLQAQ